MATETENKPVVAGEEEKKVEAPAVEAAAAAAAAAPAAADKPAEAAAAAAAGGGDTAADKKPEEKAEAAPAASGEGGDGATSSDAAAAPAKKEKEMKPTVHKANFEKDVVYLYQFTRTPMLPSISPFCLKVETWLRLAGLKYETSRARLCTTLKLKIPLAASSSGRFILPRPAGKS
uniref:GST N-terminal domain-containing protein n=1 Tax=Anopheles merus TaxID=30066 RepID=A0A182VAS3_ANOME